MSPLYDAIKPLLAVAPSDVRLFDRENPREVLIARYGAGVVISLSSVDSTQRRDEYRAVEWGTESMNDVVDAHFFPSRWEMLTWVTAKMLELK